METFIEKIQTTASKKRTIALIQRLTRSIALIMNYNDKTATVDNS